MQEKLPSKFVDSDSKTWDVQLPMSKVLRFCGQEGIKIEQVSPTLLNTEQLIKLCFIGISHYSESKGYTFDDFVDNALEGESFNKAMEATAMAIVNFTLPRLPEAERVVLLKSIKEELGAKGASKQKGS